MKSKSQVNKETVNEKRWFIYIAETNRGHLYTGISTDPAQRVREHNMGRGSKCLRGQLPVRLVWVATRALTHTEALRGEYHLKQMPPTYKKLIATGRSFLDGLPGMFF